jgi:hypothetical protein
MDKSVLVTPLVSGFGVGGVGSGLLAATLLGGESGETSLPSNAMFEEDEDRGGTGGDVMGFFRRVECDAGFGDGGGEGEGDESEGEIGRGRIEDRPTEALMLRLAEASISWLTP